MRGKVETRVGIFVLAALGVFAYMGFKIGAFRFDLARYNTYVLYFKDIAGLTRKADVKIAGVKVGWVSDVRLMSDDEMKAEAEVLILKDYALYSDSYAMIRQDGLLGPRYVEIVPGDPLLHQLQSGDHLSKPSTEPVSVDELLLQFKKIALNVQEVTESFKEAVGGDEGKEQLRQLFDNLSSSAERLASFSDIIERSFARNEDNIDALLGIGSNVQRSTTRLEEEVFPSFQESIEKVANVFDRDFGRVANKIESTAEALEDASVQARDGLRNISSVAEKIDEGKGLLGKLVNEDETYRDLRIAVKGFKNYLTKVDRLEVIFDSHFETMQRRAENYKNEDSKGYFDIRIHPNEDHFYLIQMATSGKGYVDREQVDRSFVDDQLKEINIVKIRENEFRSKPDVPAMDRFRFRPGEIYSERVDRYKRNTIRFGLQFGKIFSNTVAVRLGLIDGSAGFGIDIDVPFKTDKFRWVTSFEAYDMRGWNRKNDRRPHLKWTNKMFILRNLYFVFGADDFVSKHNANPFLGGGIRFADDDIKYFLSSFSGLVSAFSNN